MELSNLHKIGLVVLASIIVCSTAFMNGYPFVYSDTGTYIFSGFKNIIPNDRTVFYGLFLRHTSLSESLWIVIFCQSFITCTLLYLVSGLILKNEAKRTVFFIGIIGLLTLTTGLSHTVGIILPDIFNAISYLSFILILFGNSYHWSRILLLSLLLFFSIGAHLSNLPIFSLISIILLLYVLIRRIKKTPLFINTKRILIVSTISLGSFILVPFSQYVIGGKYQLSDSSHVFITAHLLESGILEKYLDEYCESRNYDLCQFEDLGWNFIWNTEGPVQQLGGHEGTKEEFNRMIGDIVSTPSYWPLILRTTLEYSVRQYFSFDVHHHSPNLQGSPPLNEITNHYSESVRDYLSSKQSRNLIDYTFINFLQLLIVLPSMLFLFLIIWIPQIRKRITPELKWMIFLLITFSILNAAICANLSTVDNRFMNRIIWLFPFFSILILIKDRKAIRTFL